jgi:hypothetical protein
MDEKQPVEPAGDIQDALASMMAVEPSLGFAARRSGPAAGVAIQPEQPPIPLVPRNEIVTMHRLLSAAQADRFQFELVPAGVPVADHLSPPEPISVPPLELMPIGATSSLE